MGNYGSRVQGSVAAVGDDSVDLIAAPGAGKRLHIVRGVVSVYQANIGSSYVYLSNGQTPPTIYWSVFTGVAANLISHIVEWGDEGINLGLNEPFQFGAYGSPLAIATFVGYVI